MILKIEDAVNKKIIQDELDSICRRDRDYRYFHASSWDDCKRKTAYQYYEAMGYITLAPECINIDAGMMRVFQNGHYMHDRWRKYLESTGALMGHWRCSDPTHPGYVLGKNERLGILRPERCDCGNSHLEYQEVGFNDPHTMWGGHVDAIVDQRILAQVLGKKIPNFEPGEELLVVDFKSMKAFTFKNLESPLPQHQTQMQIYLYLSGLSNGKFIYENKDNQTVKEYLVRIDQGFLAVKKAEAIALKQQLTTVNARGEHTLPPRGYDSKANMRCMSCKYRGHCWDEKHDKRRKESTQVSQPVPQPKLSVELSIGELDV